MTLLVFNSYQPRSLTLSIPHLQSRRSERPHSIFPYHLHNLVDSFYQNGHLSNLDLARLTVCTSHRLATRTCVHHYVYSSLSTTTLIGRIVRARGNVGFDQSTHTLPHVDVLFLWTLLQPLEISVIAWRCVKAYLQVLVSEG